MFSKSTFRHAGLLVTVINTHTRAGGGSHDTADSFRIDVLKRCKQEVITYRQVGSRHAMPASQDLMQRDDLICITDGFVLFSGLELAS